MSIHEDFLKFLGFSNDELSEQVKKWEKTCKLLNLSEEDVKRAKEEWIPKYWDTGLRGVRMCIGAYIREIMELSCLQEYKERGDKLLYGNTPCHPVCFYANKLSGGNKIHIFHPDLILSNVLSAFFDKQIDHAFGVPKFCASTACGHCGKNCIRVDAQLKGVVAEPDLVWNWGLYCNEAPKTEEYLQCQEGVNWKCVLTTMPKDIALGTHEAEDEDCINYLAEQLRISQKNISEITGINVSEVHMRQAMDEYINFLSKLEKLEKIVAENEPQPISGNEYGLYEAVTIASFETGLKYLTEALDILLEEVGTRVENKQGPLPAGTPRLACHFIPHGVPWVTRAFMEQGVNICVDIIFASASMLKNCKDDGDAYKLVAVQWFTNPSAVNMLNEAELVTDKLRRQPVDGVVCFYSFDRWLGGLQKVMIRIVEERTGIPHFYIESDLWNTGRFSVESKMERIKSIALKLKLNRMVSCRDNAKSQDN